MRDLRSNIDVQPSLHPAARTDGTATGTAVDLFNNSSAMALVRTGAWTDGGHTPSLQDSDDGATYAAVGTDDLQGTFTAIGGTAQQNAIQQIGYTGGKRYLRGMVVSATSTTGAVVGLDIALGHPKTAPAP